MVNIFRRLTDSYAADDSYGSDGGTESYSSYSSNLLLEEDGSFSSFALTDAPTDAPSDAPTDLPTDSPTDAPTISPTSHACDNGSHYCWSNGSGEDAACIVDGTAASMYTCECPDGYVDVTGEQISATVEQECALLTAAPTDSPTAAPTASEILTPTHFPTLPPTVAATNPAKPEFDESAFAYLASVPAVADISSATLMPTNAPTAHPTFDGYRLVETEVEVAVVVARLFFPLSANEVSNSVMQASLEAGLAASLGLDAAKVTVVDANVRRRRLITMGHDRRLMLRGRRLGSGDEGPVLLPPTSVSSTAEPTAEPTADPTNLSTAEATLAPSEIPTDAPTKVPMGVPTKVPTDVPTKVPMDVPTKVPMDVPTLIPNIAIAFEIESASRDPTQVAQLQEDIVTAATEGSIVANVQKEAARQGVLVAALKSMPRVLAAPTLEEHTKVATITEPVHDNTSAPTNTPTKPPTKAPTEDSVVLQRKQKGLQDIEDIGVGVVGGLLVVILATFVYTRASTSAAAQPALTPKAGGSTKTTKWADMRA
jgi:hypothetical protein